MKKYETYLKIDKDHQPSPGIEVINKLLPNVYRVDYDHRTDSVTFVTMESNHDDLVDLPSSQYETIIHDVDIFLSDECKARFEQVGFLHKFNILLHGLPGTGKTCLVNRVSQKIINKGGIVLFNPDPASLKVTFDVLNSIQPETQVLIIFEEMDQHVRNDETTLLHVLDGEIQKKNAMYIATTNYIEKIPARVKRPGRFSVVVEIGFPNAVAREAYLLTKLKDKDVVNSIVRKTEGFSIDELKEVVRGHYCMGKELNSYIRYVAKNSGKDADLPEEDDSERYDDSWDLPRDAEKNFKRALRNFVNKDGT